MHIMNNSDNDRTSIDTPTFSIIVPVYNVDLKYFSVCVNSVLDQTFTDFELILVDDGSQKYCAEACDAYAQHDKRIKVIHQKNNGVSAARNTGIDNASGEWIMFVDADDWLEKNACEILRGKLNNSDSDILIFSAFKEYADQQKPMKYGLENGKVYDFSDTEIKEQFYRRAMGTPLTDHGRFCVIYFSWDKVYRRSFLVENKLYYPVGIPKSEDKLFILTCFEKVNKVCYIDDILYHYRINDASICNRYSLSADSDRIALAERLKPIAERMDQELCRLKNINSYNRIMDEYYRFVFGIISDVLLLKYYHPDNPDYKNRRKDAKEFLGKSPFSDALEHCTYRSLNKDAKFKKLLLSNGFIGTFCYFKSRKKKARGAVATDNL